MAKRRRPKVTRNGRRRWQFWKGRDDQANIDVIRKKHGHQTDADAVRYALREQAERDRG